MNGLNNALVNACKFRPGRKLFALKTIFKSLNWMYASRRAIQMSAGNDLLKAFLSQGHRKLCGADSKSYKRKVKTPRILQNRKELRYFSHVRKRLRISSRHSKSGQRHIQRNTGIICSVLGGNYLV